MISSELSDYNEIITAAEKAAVLFAAKRLRLYMRPLLLAPQAEHRLRLFFVPLDHLVCRIDRAVLFLFHTLILRIHAPFIRKR